MKYLLMGMLLQAVADLREKEREWQEKEDRLTVVSGERDRAEATLRQHGLCPDYDIDVSLDVFSCTGFLLLCLFC